MVTVVYNGDKWLPAFLESAAHVIEHSACKLTLLAVDNASTDRSVESLRAAAVRGSDVVENAANLGVAKANNQGIRRAIADGCEYVLLVNNDTVLPVGLVDDLVTAADELDAEMISPRIVWMDDPRRTWYAGAYVDRNRGFRVVPVEQPSAQLPYLTHYAPTCCLLVKTSVFRQIGVMDERFFVYADDLDFMLRAQAAGLRLGVHPSVVVRHAAGSSTGGSLSDFTVNWASFGRALLAASHTHGVGRVSQAAYLAAWTIGSFATGRATTHATLLRARALRRGWQVGRRTCADIAP